MLSEKLIQKFNEQLTHELEASHLYLQMSAWCSKNSLDGCAGFLRHHSEEEKDHMYRLFDYMVKTGEWPIIGTVKAPQKDYDSVLGIFTSILESERQVAKKINALVGVALEEKDFATFNFLQWFVVEQHEEDHLFQSIIDRIKVINVDGKGLYFVDKEVASLIEKT